MAGTMGPSTAAGVLAHQRYSVHFSSPEVLQSTAVSADASSYRLGGVLLQLHNEDCKPVAYCSQSLSEGETRYVEIEKECLRSVWTCKNVKRKVQSCQICCEMKPTQQKEPRLSTSLPVRPWKRLAKTCVNIINTLPCRV